LQLRSETLPDFWFGDRKNSKPETTTCSRFGNRTAAACTAEFDFTTFVLPVRCAGDVELSQGLRHFLFWLRKWSRTIGTTGTLELSERMLARYDLNGAEQLRINPLMVSPSNHWAVWNWLRSFR